MENSKQALRITPQIEPTADGSPTLRHPVTGETYHSLRGALGESLHVFIESGLRKVARTHIRILEMGFGSGLNAWLTLIYAQENGLTVEYHAVELYPVEIATAASLGYTDNPMFIELHTAPWNECRQITPSFGLTKIERDLTDMEFGEWRPGGEYDIVYFDAFAPDVQPELWTEEIFSKLFEVMAENGVLVTYSARGSVKQALRKAGFRVERLPGALGKRHMLRALKQPAADN